MIQNLVKKYEVGKKNKNVRRFANVLLLVGGGKKIKMKLLQEAEETLKKLIACASPSYEISNIISSCEKENITVLKLLKLKHVFQMLTRFKIKNVHVLQTLVKNIQMFIDTITKTKKRGIDGGVNLKKYLLFGLSILSAIVQQSSGAPNSYVTRDVIERAIIETEEAQQSWTFGNDKFVASMETNMNEEIDNFCARNLSICNKNGNLNLPRKFMPQFKSNPKDGTYDISDLVAEIKRNSKMDVSEESIYSNEGKPVELPLSNLIPIQREAWSAIIDAETPAEGQEYAGILTALQYAQESGAKERGINNGGEEFANEVFNKNPILALEWDGNYMVLDGHHRLFSFRKFNEIMEKKGGHTIDKIPARIIHVPKDLSALWVIKKSHELGYKHVDLFGNAVEF
jgi:hypothetical protein